MRSSVTVTFEMTASTAPDCTASGQSAHALTSSSSSRPSASATSWAMSVSLPIGVFSSSARNASGATYGAHGDRERALLLDLRRAAARSPRPTRSCGCGPGPGLVLTVSPAACAASWQVTATGLGLGARGAGRERPRAGAVRTSAASSRVRDGRGRDGRGGADIVVLVGSGWDGRGQRTLSRNARVRACCGVVEHLRGRALLDDPAAVHEDDRVGDLAGEADLVRDDDERRAGCARGP